jgi:hypothetical protein
MMPAPADRPKLLPLLDELAGAVEELLLTGLTTASEATRQALNISFQEASRLRLLRLGSTLRIANEELGRFTRNEPTFSRRRLCFFLNRSWLLSRGLARALREDDAEAFDRLVWTPASQPVERLEVVTLGVIRRPLPDGYCAFEFRLRTVRAAGAIPADRGLVWSYVFPSDPSVKAPSETRLVQMQKQGFEPAVFLQGKVIVIQRATVAGDGQGARLILTDRSTVAAAEQFTAWSRFVKGDPRGSLERVQALRPGPLDLDTEHVEEVVLSDWGIDAPREREADGALIYPITSGLLVYDGVVTKGAEGEALRSAMDGFGRARHRPPLFGLLHYERCRFVLQPASALGDNGPEYLAISPEKMDRKVLVRSINWRAC